MEIDRLIADNAAYAAGFDPSGLSARPQRRVAVLTCMDARIDPARMLGLAPGDAHVIRNAGGLATDDAIRSLLLSQRLLGTEEVLVIHHTGCGLEGLDEEGFQAEIESETGAPLPFSLGAFADLDADVARTVERLMACAWLPRRTIRGFVFDVETGRLREVPVD
jgi:carbonic anhydrase